MNKLEAQKDYLKNIDKETDIYYYIVSTKEIIKIIYKVDFMCSKQRKGATTIQEELEKYNSSFVTNQLKNREADIVYKLRKQNIFFLIEHQSRLDYSMPYRIREYKLEIIKNAIDIKKAKTKEYEIPEVIPIVIYTGKEKWKVRLYLNQIQDERFRRVNLEKYNLVDIHNYTNEKLLTSNYFIDKMFLIEKTKNTLKYVETLEKIISQTTEEEEKKILKIIITTTLKEKIGKEKAEELVNKMEGKGEDMLAVVEMIREENRMIRKEGLEEGINKEKRKTVKRLLKMNKNIEEIVQITELSKEEILQIKQAK